MSKVIAFTGDKARKPALRLPGQTGRILLFTGVRYIRDEDWEADKQETGPEPVLLGMAAPTLDANDERLHA